MKLRPRTNERDHIGLLEHGEKQTLIRIFDWSRLEFKDCERVREFIHFDFCCTFIFVSIRGLSAKASVFRIGRLFMLLIAYVYYSLLKLQ